MSLQTTANKAAHLGNGATTVWPFSFPVLEAGHLEVLLTEPDGAARALGSGEFAIAGVGDPAGGSVTYPLAGPPLPVGARLTLLRTVPNVQGTVLSNQGGYYPEVVETQLDLLVMMAQQLDERIAASLRAPATDDAPDMVLPTAALRAGRYLAFDNDGQPALLAPAKEGGIGVDVEAAAVRIGIRDTDPAGYWTPLYVVANNHEDNVVTIRNQRMDVNGHSSIRYQDYESEERCAAGLGGSYEGNPYRYAYFIDGGNYATGHGTKDTSIVLGLSYYGHPSFPNGTVPAISVVPPFYDGVADTGGWVRIGTNRRGVAVNAIVCDNFGRVGIGPSVWQAHHANNNNGGDPQIVSILQVNGNAYFDADNLAADGAPGANSAELVVFRSQATAKSSIRVGVEDVGAMTFGMAGGVGVIGGDGPFAITFKTGITNGQPGLGTERMRLDAGKLLVGTTINTNMADGDTRLNGALWIRDGMTAPSNAAGFAAIYVDTADGDLKVKFDDGVVRSLAGGSGFTLSAVGELAWSTRSRIASPADGVLTLTNTAGTAFNRLQYGGTTSSFPAWKRSGAGFQARLADDSGYTDVAMAALTATTGAFSGMLEVGASNSVGFTGRSKLQSSADGVFTLLNNAGSDFTRLNFGGTTSSFPSLRRNGPLVEAVLADASAYAPFLAQHMIVADGMTAPGATAGLAKIYVDASDGDLKVIFGDGTIKTLVTDT